MKIIINNERPKSWNKYWSGMHWTERNADANRVHTLVKESLGTSNPPLAYPVEIVITVYFKNRPYDCDNIACKPYIDGLKGALLVDDNPKYIKSVTMISLVDKENPRIEIEIY